MWQSSCYIVLLIMVVSSSTLTLVAGQSSSIWIGTGSDTPTGDGNTISTPSTISGQPTDVAYGTITGRVYFTNWGVSATNSGKAQVRYATSVSGVVGKYIADAAFPASSPVVNTQSNNAYLTAIRGINFHISSTNTVLLIIMACESNRIVQSDLTTNYVSVLIGNGASSNAFNTATSIEGPTMGAPYNGRLYCGTTTNVVRMSIVSPILLRVTSVTASSQVRNIGVFRGNGYFVMLNMHAIYQIHLISGIHSLWKGTPTTAGMSTTSSFELFTNPEGIDFDCNRKILYIGHKSLFQVAMTSPQQRTTQTVTDSYSYTYSARHVTALNRVFISDYGGKYIYTITTPTLGNTWAGGIAACVLTRTESAYYGSYYGWVLLGTGLSTSAYQTSWDGTSVGIHNVVSCTPVDVAYNTYSGISYISCYDQHNVLRVTNPLTGTVQQYISSSPSEVFDTVASNSRFASVHGLLVHAPSATTTILYSFNRDSSRVVQVDLTNNFVTTFVGNGQSGSTVNVAGTSAKIQPSFGAVHQGNVIITCFLTNTIVKVAMLNRMVTYVIPAMSPAPRNIGIYKGVGYITRYTLHGITRVGLITGAYSVWK
eukprot:PhF_6_TR37895/c0_g1_i1/m.56572